VTRFVISADVALRLAERGAVINDDHQLLAPAMMRSQLLSTLYQAVQRGELARTLADQHLDYVRSLRLRLLGDRVLQRQAWRVAEDLGWPDTYDAEYVALTQLQADALVTLDPDLARTAKRLVTVAPMKQLLA
jgi:predicted nucleic acid-binding protein